ncbi:MAG: hypothetical protein D3916_08155 [Candidatus Electrothrix sp. MAN1_4]|nr:hypothetical protein [Candidatus Electrothrix sp. MAN1_4]
MVPVPLKYLFWTVMEKTNICSPGKHIFVACFQKAGSTYLTRAIAEYTGFRCGMYVHAGLHNEQFINEVKLRIMRHANFVIQQHTKGTERNILVLKQNNIKPIVLVRNLFDVIISLRDHHRREDIRHPIGYIHRQYLEMKEEEQLLFITKTCSPWYFSFLISWVEASAEIDTLWVTYEELITNPVGTISRILDYQGLSFETQKIKDTIVSISGEKTRLNKGISGRGKSLPLSAKQALIDIADCWKIDDNILARIGLDKESREETLLCKGS